MPLHASALRVALRGDSPGQLKTGLRQKAKSFRPGGSRRGKKDRVTANNHKDFRLRSGETPITVRFNRLKPAAALRASLCEAWRLDVYEPQRPTGLRPKAQRFVY